MRMLAKAALGLALATAQVQAQTPGVTATAVKIGGTFPFSGPASALGNTGKGLIAYIKMLNDNGGVNGRKIEYLALDDAYSPPKAVEQMRKLVEQDDVTFIFSALGTASNSATIKYLNNKKIPDAFIVSGAARFAVAADYPYTTTALPSYAAEAAIYAKYVRSEKPGAKVGILFQNDDLGRDFVAGFKSVYGNDYGRLVAAVSYEVADATVESQILNLKSEGVEVLMLAATPKFAAQAIRRTAEVGWKPMQIINLVSSSISATLNWELFGNVVSAESD